MASAERSYEYSSLLIINGIYDTLEILGGRVVRSIQSYADEKTSTIDDQSKFIEGWVTIYGKENLYRFIARSKIYGCTLNIESLNPDNLLSSETETRLLTTIFCALEQLLEDAIVRSSEEVYWTNGYS